MVKISKFNVINQTELDGNYLTCANCANWLTAPIYQSSRSAAMYCGICTSYKRRMQQKERNQTLEYMLRNSNFNYPCQYRNCDMIAYSKQLEKHMKQCPYAPIKCIFCEDFMILNEFNVVTHLLVEHLTDPVSLIQSQDPVATLSLKMPLSIDNQKMFVIELKGHTFIVFVQFIDGCLYFTAGEESNADATLSCNKTFIIQYQNQSDSTELKVKGDMVDVKQMFQSIDTVPKAKLSFHSEIGTELCVKVYFCGFDSFESNVIDECPICFNRFTTVLYQCSNGHSFCERCIQFVDKCAICRTGMDHIRKLNLKHVSNNFRFPCPNAESGCLHYMKATDLQDHKIHCLYCKDNCDECNIIHSRKHIVRHMQDEHTIYDNLSSIYEVLDKSVIEQNAIHYVKYGNKIFRFTRTLIGLKDTLTLNFMVQLLYHDNNIEAKKYRYEVHILDKHLSTNYVFKVSNICRLVKEIGYTGMFVKIC